MKDLIKVEFYGDELLMVEHHGEPYVALKPICQNLGVDLMGQWRKISQDEKRWQPVKLSVKAQDGKLREMLCIPLRKLPAWLMSISPSKVKPEIREKLVRYQEECDRVLWEYWSRMRGSPPPARATEEEGDEDPGELYRRADELARELQAIRKLEEEGLEEDEARLELCRRAILGGRAVAVLRDLRLTQSEISALFLARMAKRGPEEAARIAGVTREEAEEAFRAFDLLGRDPWDVLWAVEALTVPLPWEEGASYGRLAESVDRAVRRLSARAGSVSLLRRMAPGWLVFGERWVYVTAEVFGEFGYGRPGDIWVLAERMGWRKVYRRAKVEGRRTDEPAAGLPVSEFEARYFGKVPSRREVISAPEPVARMAEWLINYWNRADGKHRDWLETQFRRAFPDFAAEEGRRG